MLKMILATGLVAILLGGGAKLFINSSPTVRDRTIIVVIACLVSLLVASGILFTVTTLF